MHDRYELLSDTSVPQKIDTCLMIHAIATTSKRVDTTVLMLLSKMQDHYKGNNYTKVMVNVTPFAVDATSDQIKLTKNGTHNTFLQRMDPVPRKQKKTSISNGVLSRLQRYQNFCKQNADRYCKERLISVQHMQRDEPVQSPQAAPMIHPYAYKDVGTDICHKLPEQRKRTQIIHPHSYIGRNVMKSFSNILYTGKIVGYSQNHKYWNLLYNDGDEEEDFDENDLKLYLVALYLMRSFLKSFAGNYCEGRIYGYTLGFKLWYVLYADNSFEYLNEDDKAKQMRNIMTQMGGGGN
eukprot:scaffold191_cov273-Chaetoceros_neogracile.AAC.16